MRPVVRRTRSAFLVALTVLASLVIAGPAQAQTSSSFELRVSKSSDRSASSALEGATVHGLIYVFVAPDSGPTRVSFYLDDPLRTGQPISVEGAAPWDFAGTAKDGTAKPFDVTTLPEGNHTITAAVEHAGGTDVVSSTFFKSDTPPPNPYELRVSTAPDRSNSTILEGAALSGKAYIFTAPDTDVKRVSFYLDDPDRTGDPKAIEGVAPFDFAGTNNDGTAQPFDLDTLTDGSHTVTAVVEHAGGTDIIHATFTKEAAPPPEPSTYELRVSLAPDRSSSNPLNGTTLTGDVYVFVSPDEGPSRVSFWLDDPERTGDPVHIEGGAPWDYAGTNDNGTAKPLDLTTLAAGEHTITAAVEHAGGTDILQATFTSDDAERASHELALSRKPDRSEAVALAGTTLTTKGAYIFLRPDTNVQEVRFHLDDPQLTGTPHMIETVAPLDFNGTNSDGTAVVFDASSLSSGEHTISAAIDRSDGVMEVVHATFTVDISTCSPVPCEDVLIDLPYELTFDADAGGVLDGAGTGTGLTWVDKPTKATGYLPGNLAVDPVDGELDITTTAGLMHKSDNAQDNALAVGIDAPNQITVMRTTLVAPPKGSGNFEQAGLWFGNDEDNFVKLNVQSTSSGSRVEFLEESGGAVTETKVSGANAGLNSSRVLLELRANPSDRTITASYRIGDSGSIVKLANFTVPGELFSFDAAGIDPTLGTRSFGGIYASHRRGPSPLVYRFDQFSVTKGEAPPPTDNTGILFTRTALPVPFPTAMVWGPDDRLYVTELLGTLHAITLNPDGTVASDEVTKPLGSRLTLGLTVDPASTPENVILWAAHSSESLSDGTPNSGMLTRLTGAGHMTREDVVTGLPRAKANHGTNSIHFGPDGKLYIAQGGNTGAGAPNDANTEFGDFEEQPLSAALLVADVKAAGFDGSCNNETDIFGPPPCDVQVYASGLRNTYDFVFHTNGGLYGPDNGLGVTGTFPPSPTPPCLGMGSTTSWESGGHNPGAQPDSLNRLVQGGYYGHPNPRRDECVFGDGHYQGVAALPTYRVPMFNLGNNRSANGTIEYLANRFCGELQSDILIANYSVGDDLTRIELSADGQSVAKATSLVGGFTDPLPVAQDPSGRIFVGETGTNKVTVLTPDERGCWNNETRVPAGVLDAGGAGLNGLMYMVAGKTETGPVSSVRSYDPQAGQWSPVADLPGPAVENPAVVSHHGMLYAFGGSTGPFSGAVDNAAAFDPATGVWTALPPMPTARGGAAAAVVGGKIYVVGGLGGDGASLSTVEVFDPATGEWSAGPSMSTRRDNPGAAAIDGMLYVVGGRTRNADGSVANATLASMERLDPAAGTWSSRASMPTGRRTFSTGTIGDRFQVMGGEASGTGDGTFSQNEEYDPASDTWRTLKPMPSPRHGAATATIDGVVYTAGGGTKAGSSFADIHEAFRFQE